MYGLEHLLLNVFVLLVFLLFVPIVLEINTYKFFNEHKRSIHVVSAMLAITACLLFPIPIMDGYIFDLRLAALTIGGLYGGIPAAMVLAGFTIFFRFIIGGIGAIASVIVISILFILLVCMARSFQKASRKRKIVIASSLSTLAAIVAILNSMVLFGASFSILFLTLYGFTTLCTTAFIVYLYEVFHDHILVHKRVMRAEKMEVVSHLASSISHEVRNPLTTVRGFMQMMLQNEFSEEKRKEFLKISIDEIDRANDIIRDYLTFAKPSPEKVTNLNIKEELERTLHIVTPFAKMNGVEIQEKVDDYSFRGEEQLIQQCLINLTKNCIEAMPNKGRLTIETKEEHGNLLLVISDNGKGMTKEQLARIGEPYFTTKGREGTGLGMLVSIRIIESMSGKLSVESQVNEGTSFFIRFPLVE
ncbi:ATP-binding protein [Halalkalibacter okhensis]|uniref:ATP-binding protein n=1 Tax=Halalkalibacter okhensis TaxID=333138 RepID=UPI00068F4DD7|nr:ATP-binding protein [Halalkalibacter okhensis]